MITPNMCASVSVKGQQVNKNRTFSFVGKLPSRWLDRFRTMYMKAQTSADKGDKVSKQGRTLLPLGQDPHNEFSCKAS